MVLEGQSSWNREHRIDKRTDGEEQGNKSEKRGHKGRWLAVQRMERNGERRQEREERRNDEKEGEGIREKRNLSRQTNCKFFRNDVM